jgi:hypothetical protein
LALPFRPVTAGFYCFGACVMPGARKFPRSKLRGIKKNKTNHQVVGLRDEPDYQVLSGFPKG